MNMHDKWVSIIVVIKFSGHIKRHDYLEKPVLEGQD